MFLNINTKSNQQYKFTEKKFKKQVGYSDHTPDVITPALSVIAGASFIEKHFTYNKIKNR